MASLQARPFAASDTDAWDRFVVSSPMGTLVSTRRFLAYHGDRFLDRSLVITRGNKWVAVLSAASWPSAPEHVIGHPGATFGGLVLRGLGQTDLAEEALVAAKDTLRETYGATTLEVRLPMAHLAAQPDEAQLHALFRLGARFDRMDLWSAIALDRPFHPTDACSAHKALRAGLTAGYETAPEAFEELYGVLCENLRARHDRTPVHSLSELLDLRERLGGEQALYAVRLPDGRMAAGAWLLRHRADVVHTQYLASRADALELRPMDLLLHSLAEGLATDGVRVLSFGASTEDGGKTLNAGLHRFKTKMGGGALVHAHARWTLEP
ncbi:MAG: GNAT family N-acetyltransferase [Sandaracinaceae bacterium]